MTQKKYTSSRHFDGSSLSKLEDDGSASDPDCFCHEEFANGWSLASGETFLEVE